HLGRIGFAHPRDLGPVDGRMHGQHAALQLRFGQARGLQNVLVAHVASPFVTIARWSSIPMETRSGAVCCRVWKSVFDPMPRQPARIKLCATAPPSVVPGPVTMKRSGANSRAAIRIASVKS